MLALTLISHIDSLHSVAQAPVNASSTSASTSPSHANARPAATNAKTRDASAANQTQHTQPGPAAGPEPNTDKHPKTLPIRGAYTTHRRRRAGCWVSPHLWLTKKAQASHRHICDMSDGRWNVWCAGMETRNAFATIIATMTIWPLYVWLRRRFDVCSLVCPVP